jgi:CubicO group peptidase (beta-lactamase class C family)
MLLTAGGALLAAAAVVPAANLAIAAQRYGPEYLRRLALWGRAESMDDAARFPARPIAAAARPWDLPQDPDGPARLRAAFAAVAAHHALPGATLEAFLAASRSTSLLVLRRDRLVFEAYANGAGPTTPMPSMSMSKTVLAMLVVAAIDRGEIAGFDVPAEALLPELPGLRGSGVTLRHLLRMTSGLGFESEWPLHRLTWRLLFAGGRVAYFTPDIRRYIATARPARPPGTRFAYDDRGAQLVGLILERATGRDAATALAERIWTQIGMEHPASWNIDRDGGFEKMESGMNAVARDWLRLGRLMLADGAWEGTAVLPAGPLREALSPPIPADPPDLTAGVRAFEETPGLFYGMLSWGLRDGTGPPDAFAAGLFGQVLYLARGARAVLLRTGLEDGIALSWAVVLRDLARAMEEGSPNRSGD